MEKGVGFTGVVAELHTRIHDHFVFFFILEVLKGKTIHSLVLTFILRTRLELDPELSH